MELCLFLKVLLLLGVLTGVSLLGSAVCFFPASGQPPHISVDPRLVSFCRGHLGGDISVNGIKTYTDILCLFLNVLLLLGVLAGVSLLDSAVCCFSCVRTASSHPG